MVEVCRHFFAGGYADARAAAAAGRDYDLVINCSTTVPMVWTGPRHQRTRLHVAADDDDTMYRCLENATRLIRSKLRAGKTVFAYSDAGRRRSATVAAAYLMTIGGDAEDARSRYPGASPAVLDRWKTFLCDEAICHSPTKPVSSVSSSP